MTYFLLVVLRAGGSFVNLEQEGLRLKIGEFLTKAH